MKIDFIEVPLFYGCDRPGVEHGPKALLENNIVDLFEKYGNEVKDKGYVLVNSYSEEEKYKSHPTMKYLKGVVETNEDLANKVEDSLKNGRMPFTIGGDHSLGLGSLAGVSAALGKDFGVIWIDAHADINTTESSPSGNIHGMPLGASFGVGSSELRNIHFEGKKLEAQNTFIIGARSVDEGEVDLIDSEKVNVWYMEEIQDKGMDKTIEELLSLIKKRGLKNIHISYDIDSLSSELVPGTGTPVEDGMHYEESEKLIRALIKTGLVRSIDFVEYNPKIDKNGITLTSVMKMLDVFASSLGEIK